MTATTETNTDRKISVPYNGYSDSITSLLHVAAAEVECLVQTELTNANLHLTVRQLATLEAIQRLGNGAGVTAAMIVLATGVDRSTTSDIIERLSSRNLVRSERSKTDRRALEVKLTSAGLGLMARGLAVRNEVEGAVLAALPMRGTPDAMLEACIAASNGRQSVRRKDSTS